MTATQTRIVDADIQLTALSSSGKSISAKLSEISHPSTPDESAQPRISLSDSYDPEICTADIRIIPSKPASNVPLRLRARNILSNKIARRSFQAMVIFSTITLLYQLISLIPAFQGALAASQGLQLQVKGESNSRQSLAYGFLSECANRKVCASSARSGIAEYIVKAQNLPLGSDCLKYLTMTPKAPPDMDNWMIDPPGSNTSTAFVARRNITVSLKQLNQSRQISTPKAEKTSSRDFWAIELYNLRSWVLMSAPLLVWLICVR
jgi:hypothetical protein